MSWTLEWGPVARRDLLSIPWPTAAHVDRAVMAFAETSRGPVERVSPHDPRRLALVVPGAVAYLFADFESGILRVNRVIHRR